ncbi:MAG: hypothetical protein ACRCWR_09960, partial [Saezia sp.]
MPLPQEIQELSHWTTHTNKRPTLPPDQWNNALTYEEAKAKSSHIGLLVAPAPESPYLILDIDYPGKKPGMSDQQIKEEKEALTAYIISNNIQLGSSQHLDLIAPTLNSIKDLSITPLLTQTYTEFSPSLVGLRMIIRSEDKHRFPKAYKKAKLFKGQIDFKDQFMTITEHQFPGSPSTVLEVPLMSLADAFGFTETTQASITIPDHGGAPTDLPNEAVIRDT